MHFRVNGYLSSLPNLQGLPLHPHPPLPRYQAGCQEVPQTRRWSQPQVRQKAHPNRQTQRLTRRENAGLNHQGESVPHALANSPNQTDMDGTSKDPGPMLPPPDTEKLSPREGKELIRALRELVAKLGSGPQLEACPEPKSLPTTCSQALLLLALPQAPHPSPRPSVGPFP